MEFTVEKTKTPKARPADDSKLGFGHIFTDHMFMMDWDQENGWHDAKILPFQDIPLSPAANCLHYSQEVFEGMKAYRTAEGVVQLFRPEENFKRLNTSCDRICMPKIDVDFCVEALKALVELDAQWVPKTYGASLYIRPFVIATERNLGAHTSTDYKFLIIMSPSGAYYESGLAPVKIYVETNYVRAVLGGTGAVKTGGNYAASMKAQEVAEEQGYSQVLWLDAIHHKYIGEVGAMNVMFVLGDEVITPELDGTILPGITRKSALEVLRHKGYKVSERSLDIDEVVEAYHNGQLKEAFGTGTAAVISPIGELKYKDLVMRINNEEIGPISQMLYDTMTGIQWGKIEDPFGWVVPVCKLDD